MAAASASQLPSSAISTASTAVDPPPQSAGFQFPPHYSFPPFFTLQPVHATRTSQLQSWSTLIQSYCRYHRIFSLTLIDALSTPLFANDKLGRKLSLRDARAIIQWMTTSEGGNRAEWRSSTSSKKSSSTNEEAGTAWVWWRRPEEWASAIEEWVDRTGQKGTVVTLYEITESDATKREEFHGMDEELLKRSLGICVRRGRAQVFGNDGGEGVKFF